MTVQDVLAAVSQAGGRLTPNDDTLIVEARAPLPPDVMALVRQHKVALLALLQQTPGTDIPRAETPALVPTDDGAPDLPQETGATIPGAPPTQHSVLAPPEPVWQQSGYTREELRILRWSEACNPAAFAEKVRIMHQRKHVFEGSFMGPKQAAGPVDARLYQTPPGTCYACDTTRRWRSVYGVLICARCHPPASPKLVVRWEGEER